MVGYRYKGRFSVEGIAWLSDGQNKFVLTWKCSLFHINYHPPKSACVLIFKQNLPPWPCLSVCLFVFMWKIRFRNIFNIFIMVLQIQYTIWRRKRKNKWNYRENVSLFIQKYWNLKRLVWKNNALKRFLVFWIQSKWPNNADLTKYLNCCQYFAQFSSEFQFQNWKED